MSAFVRSFVVLSINSLNSTGYNNSHAKKKEGPQRAWNGILVHSCPAFTDIEGGYNQQVGYDPTYLQAYGQPLVYGGYPAVTAQPIGVAGYSVQNYYMYPGTMAPAVPVAQVPVMDDPSLTPFERMYGKSKTAPQPQATSQPEDFGEFSSFSQNTSSGADPNLLSNSYNSFNQSVAPSTQSCGAEIAPSSSPRTSGYSSFAPPTGFGVTPISLGSDASSFVALSPRSPTFLSPRSDSSPYAPTTFGTPTTPTTPQFGTLESTQISTYDTTVTPSQYGIYDSSLITPTQFGTFDLTSTAPVQYASYDTGNAPQMPTQEIDSISTSYAYAGYGSAPTLDTYAHAGFGIASPTAAHGFGSVSAPIQVSHSFGGYSSAMQNVEEDDFDDFADFEGAVEPAAAPVATPFDPMTAFGPMPAYDSSVVPTEQAPTAGIDASVSSAPAPTHDSTATSPASNDNTAFGAHVTTTPVDSSAAPTTDTMATPATNFNSGSLDPTMYFSSLGQTAPAESSVVSTNFGAFEVSTNISGFTEVQQPVSAGNLPTTATLGVFDPSFVATPSVVDSMAPTGAISLEPASNFVPTGASVNLNANISPVDLAMPSALFVPNLETQAPLDQRFFGAVSPDGASDGSISAPKSTGDDWDFEDYEGTKVDDGRYVMRNTHSQISKILPSLLLHRKYQNLQIL